MLVPAIMVLSDVAKDKRPGAVLSDSWTGVRVCWFFQRPDTASGEYSKELLPSRPFLFYADVFNSCLD